MMSKTVRIGCAAGFWGDTETAAPELLASGKLDYLVFDYLAEITMSIMAGARLRRADAGYATDFVTRVMEHALAAAMNGRVRIVTNAGGVNPLACRDALRALAERQGFSPRIAVVLGDDLLPKREVLATRDTREMFTGAPMPPFLLSMNAYLGAEPIARALAEGADIVITGRVVDSALVLGPLMHEFGWSSTDYDRLAMGSLAGHVVECGAQATGGLFTDWEEVEGYDRMGFPIVACEEDGSFVVEKPPGSGGLVTPAVIYEQVLYEIGDPRAYVLPDVTCDFSHVVAVQAGPDRVRVRGAKGRSPPERYKVSATYPDGFKASASFLLIGEDAAPKGEKVARALLEKTERLLVARGFGPYRDKTSDVLGAEAAYGPHSRARGSREVVVRLAMSHDRSEALELALRELPQAGTAMAPGLSGGGMGGRPKPIPMIRLFSFLVDPAELDVVVDLDGERIPVETLKGPATEPSAEGQGQRAESDETPVKAADSRIPLVRLAHGRSGDKGDHANIGIIARDPSYLPFIEAALTERAVADYMRHVLDPEHGRVTRFSLPGCHAFNFLLEHSLGGGGVASLRADPQGKAYAQQLLSFEVPVSRDVFERAESDFAARKKHGLDAGREA
jgi:hypothetical protein